MHSSSERHERYFLPQPCSSPAAGVDRSRLYAFTVRTCEGYVRSSKHESIAAKTKVARSLRNATPWTHRLTHIGVMAFFCALVYALVYAKAAFSQLDARATVPSRYVFLL